MTDTDDPFRAAGVAGDTTRQRDPLAKALRALDALVDHPSGSLGVRELAKELGTAPSTTHRVLATLHETGMVMRKPNGRYAVGFELQRLAWRVNARFPAPTVADPILRELADSTGETAALGFFDPVRHQLTFVATAHTQHRLRYLVDLFQSIPIHAGASGLSILAFLDEALREQILAEQELEAFTERTLTSPAEIRAAVERVRAAGYAFSRGQRAEGAVGIAAPVWDKDGSVLGNVMVTIPEQRFDPEKEPDLADQVRRSAARMTRVLGGSPP